MIALSSPLSAQSRIARTNVSGVSASILERHVMNIERARLAEELLNREMSEYRRQAPYGW